MALNTRAPPSTRRPSQYGYDKKADEHLREVLPDRRKQPTLLTPSALAILDG
ncbi:MAG: hypothetical protein KF795_22260 [Labilithrix sp.]|nr:hypothetical protein [Labilithrix sp.]